MPTALVVDDNSNIRRLVSRVLRRLEVDTDEASDGTEALLKMERHPYDVVILDLMMPIQSGFDVIKTLQQRRAADILDRIVVMTAATGHLSDEVLKCVRKALAKPFSVLELSRIVQECIEEQRSRPPRSDDR